MSFFIKIVFMKSIYEKFCFLILVMISFAACTSARKALRSGDYETAINKCIQKLQHKDDDETIIILEAAYDKAYYRDMDQINFYKNEGNPVNLLAIYQLYQNIRNRYNSISPLLPLHIQSKNRDAVFNNVSDADLIGAKNKATEYLYAKAVLLLNDGNRFHSREAYDLIQQLITLDAYYKDANQKLQQALYQGKAYIKFEVLSTAIGSLPGETLNSLQSTPVGSLNQLWQEYHNMPGDTSHFDYRIVVNLKQILISPDNLSSNSYTDTKQVEDGWEYVLDSHGNVAKDSLGNDIKKTRYKTINAVITEVAQNKTASINGEVQFINLANGNLMASFPLQNTINFAHNYAIASGDLNALSDASKQKIIVPPMPFPTELEVLNQNAEQLKPMILQIIRNYQQFLN